MRPSHRADGAPHAWGGRMHARPTCTLRGTLYVCTRTVGSRRKSVRHVSRRISTVRGQNPSVESYSRVPGHWHRQWTALDLPFMCLNMSLFCGAGRDGLGVKISSGRRHMGAVPIEPPVSPPPPSADGLYNCFTVTQAMYIVVLSIGRLYEHHMVPENVCDA